ncbi:F0F1 ATP synthase subunit epsilon [Hoyosella rhizosphaerae]|uniref:ATP synthase epsilon chain n=1 Tax=Hoyosella rhizosphaerae TaxID=1755582 RepID=A0A916UEQ9_9ACTN|nr:F0F1 ATP synthase subunit epsilon [Hoyosella rhizosphaerae]MBN4927830.1 F0F1 ATP synthase subunit epsilon [Hoyosella rhizosphaerae]GGC70309.1 ATP synthase epsilon chain [Hoyosella rhizosphaerae]
MAEMTVELVAVEQRFWSGSATLVVAQTTEGEIGIMPGHEPMLGQLTEGGVVTITTDNGERVVAAVDGGFLSVTARSVTVLAESAQWAQDVVVDEVRQQLDEAGDDAKLAARARGRLRAVDRM